jgi:hypothetical protein
VKSFFSSFDPTVSTLSGRSAISSWTNTLARVDVRTCGSK